MLSVCMHGESVSGFILFGVRMTSKVTSFSREFGTSAIRAGFFFPAKREKWCARKTSENMSERFQRRLKRLREHHRPGQDGQMGEEDQEGQNIPDFVHEIGIEKTQRMKIINPLPQERQSVNKRHITETEDSENEDEQPSTSRKTVKRSPADNQQIIEMFSGNEYGSLSCLFCTTYTTWSERW